ncbi:MAG: YpmS family protein [Sporolactobacillus sp.]
MNETRRTIRKGQRPAVWRAAFFTLLFLVIALIGLALYYLSAGFSGEQATPESYSDQQTNRAIFSVQANKTQLQSLINQQITDSGDKRLSYHVEIGDQVVLKGSYKLLFTGIPFSLAFKPIVSNGDVVLRETSVRLGDVKLPDEEVLAFLKSGTKFPKWVAIQPAKKQVYLNLTRVQVQKGLYLRAEVINLPKNIVSFSVHQKNK